MLMLTKAAAESEKKMGYKNSGPVEKKCESPKRQHGLQRMLSRLMGCCDVTVDHSYLFADYCCMARLAEQMCSANCESNCTNGAQSISVASPMPTDGSDHFSRTLGASCSTEREADAVGSMSNYSSHYDLPSCSVVMASLSWLYSLSPMSLVALSRNW